MEELLSLPLAGVEDINPLDSTIAKRILELSRLAHQREIVVFSDFLNLDQLHTLHNLPKNDLFTQYVTYGGYIGAERQMVAFYQDALYFNGKGIPTDILPFPMRVISIEPVHIKYSEDLTHRDYLGAILNLGIERSKIGDILVSHNSACVFLQTSLVDYIIKNLIQVRRTSVIVKQIPLGSFRYHPEFTEIKGSVSSLRLDAILSLALSHSRNKLTGLIQGGKVFINGRLILSNSYKVKEEDIISVRGVGKFKFAGVTGKTKKDRDYVLIYKYL